MQRYELHAAVKRGDLERVNKLLDNPAVGINNPDHEGLTPLIHAVSSPDAGVEILRTLLRHGAKVDARKVYGAALNTGDPQKVSALLETGVDIHYKDVKGNDALIDAVCGRDVRHDPNLIELLKLLIASGVSLTSITVAGETALRILSRVGRFDAVNLLLEAGADRRELNLPRLMKAVAFGSPADVEAVIEDGADLEEQDYWQRTAWLLAVQIGEVSKARLLFDWGANVHARAIYGQSAIFYAIQSGSAAMLECLLEIGFDIHEWNGSGRPALMLAAEEGNPGIVALLLKAGADVDEVDGGGTALGSARTRDVAIMLLNAGADPHQLSHEGKRAILGYRPKPDLAQLDAVSTDDFRNGRTRRFGRKNPETMKVPFWQAMVRAGVNASIATGFFAEAPKYHKGYEPTWCAERHGQSITFLPDGRIVLVGGEHEDYYDPDFCIYNDVFVHGVDGELTIYGYPSDVFPPTDFHTATLVGEFIYLIGSVGYTGTRRYGETPLYRLDTKTFAMESLRATGENPGWIIKHRAMHLSGHEIEVRGGKIGTLVDGREAFLPNESVYILDVKQLIWRSR